MKLSQKPPVNKAIKKSSDLNQRSSGAASAPDAGVIEQIPESQGDLADRAQAEIDTDLQIQIAQARRRPSTNVK